jgi:drug/metabolite transporter (DMT)-like permease
MLVGWCVLKRRYSLREYLSAVLVSLGLTLFTLVDQAMTPSFNFIGIELFDTQIPMHTLGIALVSASVCCEAVMSNLQQRTLQNLKGTQIELVN